ncbi:hypothetical protein SUGI_0111550 [Cryptomeria japonica]|uniref:uncharacterized protein LOC131078813 isoform X2 n=1 Tax=Cryptomeria japonica TaxID=3369 RepID=UPI002408E26A|nr:uncharacterized protein LOC131078813 isoform X2 [Cryptomeria japonica]GLJ09545.1 hypothetical protein SUGI_0111550 [Cryptomeria japonica]
MILQIKSKESSNMGEGPSEELKDSLRQASAYVDNCQYEDAFVLLEKLEQQFPGIKDVSELVSVAEICFAATKTSCSCTKPQKSKTLDWYVILKVEENAEIDVIRRRYRRLALLLHPDKNKHPKAEAAFKLVSEAYACLSDKKKRALYNVERSKLSCKRCSQKVQNSKGTFGSSTSDQVEHEQKYSKTWRLFVEKDATYSDRMSDEEKLQMFRERARVRVDSTAQAWQERRARFKEEFHIVNNAFQSNRVERKEFPTFDANECLFPSYPHLRMPMEMKTSTDIPIFKNSEDRFFCYNQERNESTYEVRGRYRREKLETPIYEESTSKKVPFSVFKKNILRKDVKEILKERKSFCRESSSSPRNLDGLFRKLQAESGSDARHGFFRDSDIFRKYKMDDNKNSINVKNKYHKRGTEISDTDEESEETFDWYDNSCKSSGLHCAVEDEFNLVKKKLQEESEFNLQRKDFYCFPEGCDRSFKGAGNVGCEENVRKSEELLKTLGHLREEAKDVAATLDELRKSVGSEEDHGVRNLFCQKFPVAAES